MTKKILTTSILLVAPLLALAIPLGASAQQTPTMPALSEDQVNRLNQGEIIVDVTNARVPIGDVLAVIDAPVERVAEVILDFDHWDEFIPNMSEAQVVERVDDGTLLCAGVTDTPWPMDDRSWTIRATYQATQLDGVDVWVSGWDYVPGSGNLEDTEGYWLLVPWGADGSRTLLRYYLVVDLGTWVPDVLLSWGTENLLPDIVEGIRTRLGA
jgi:hypothetical protein